MKLTPARHTEHNPTGAVYHEKRTERLNIVLVKTALNILDHQACLSYLRVADHPNLDDDAGKQSQSERTKNHQAQSRTYCAHRRSLRWRPGTAE